LKTTRNRINLPHINKTWEVDDGFETLEKQKMVGFKKET
jgi:hypothetical protein